MAKSQPTSRVLAEQLAGRQLVELLAEVKAVFLVAGELKVIPEFPDYAVSSDGRVFSARPCRWQPGIREMRQTTTGVGYCMVRLHNASGDTAKSAHRLVAQLFLPPPTPEQRVVRHLDGVRSNNHAGNLAWGTDADNMQDMIRHGRTLRGRRNTNSKLTENRVRLIRGLVKEEFATDVVAHLFGVSKTEVERVVSGEAWGWLDER